MRVRIIRRVNLRYGKPQTDAPIRGELYKGFDLDVVRQTAGTPINGNDVWYQDRNGDYLWSGATTRLDSIASAALPPPPPAAAYAPNKIGWGLRDFNIPDLWEQYGRGGGVNVAILDTGIDLNHPDLRGTIRDPATDTIAIGPAGNIEGAWDVLDTDGHGTACAGVLAAQGLTTYGVAPQCNLHVIKIAETTGGIVSGPAFLKSIEWCVDKGIHVVSISFGQRHDTQRGFKAGLEAATEAGMAVVAATGRRAPMFPAMLSSCIAVGAIDSESRLTPSTLRDTSLDVCAPGSSIQLLQHLNKPLRLGNGTSYATPFVAGVIALAYQSIHFTGLTHSPSAIQEALRRTATRSAVDGYEYRIINPLALLRDLNEPLLPA